MALGNFFINVEMVVHDYWLEGKKIFVLVEVKIESLDAELILMEGEVADV